MDILREHTLTLFYPQSSASLLTQILSITYNNPYANSLTYSSNA